MASCTIKTHKHGDLTFTARDDGGYAYLKTNKPHQPYGKQICAGGGFWGNPLTANSATLKDASRK